MCFGFFFFFETVLDLYYVHKYIASVKGIHLYISIIVYLCSSACMYVNENEMIMSMTTKPIYLFSIRDISFLFYGKSLTDF